MKKNVLIVMVFSIALVLVVVLTISFYISTYRTNIPATFTIAFNQEGTSSAAERDYNATLVFENGLLVHGEQKYDTGNQYSETHDVCILTNSVWVDSITKSVCNIHAQYFRYVKDSNGADEGATTEGNAPPLTITNIQTRIKTGDIAPVNTPSCQRFMLCYKITE